MIAEEFQPPAAELEPESVKPAGIQPGKNVKKNLPADHPKMKFLVAAFLLIISASAGFLGGWLGSRNQEALPTIQKQQVVLKTQGQLISNIAKTVGESVVSVNTTSTGVSTNSFLGFSQPTEQQGAGTGIIISANGLIITNRHVVPTGTTKVSVTLSDGTEYDNVQVVGRTSTNDTLDIAFLKIQDTKGKKLVAAQVGDSSKMQVGDPVVAIGNALGQFQNTVTSGIISGYGRSVQASDSSGGNSESLEDLFQTDAAINEGNSGGPLVNLDGQVIGINTAVAGNAENIGFAIPINDVSGLIKSVKETGRLQRPYLGIVYITLTDDLAKQYNLSVTRGAYVPPITLTGQDSVIDGGPADKAGVKEGDIITKVNDTAIDQNNGLTAVLGKHAVGEKVTLTLIRNGKQQTVSVTLGAAPTDA
ncbi:MAG TPA: trypsin-like peptidase domain-containing protein [Nevskiaceae bacterium]|nr:trypsin-like peptidase domain-containing protein [Nevskiaceae bacterium]